MAALANGLKCTACGTRFEDSESQRSHYKLDWHRYNLKRKVAGLTPVGVEDFERRVAAVAGASAPKPDFRGQCKACRKSFSSEKLYATHLESKKHRQTVATIAAKAARGATNLSELEHAEGAESPAEDEGSNPASADEIEMSENEKGIGKTSVPETGVTSMEGVEGEESDEEDDALEEPAAIGPDVCIFCNKVAKGGMEENCKHMLSRHGFFIPDQEYLVDKEGLLEYCSEKVKIGCLCLVCNGRGKNFHSWRSVQQHMTDRSHCRLLYEEGEDLHEFEEFYDFSASYPDAGAAGVDGGAVEGEGGKPLVARTINVTEIGELQLLDGRIVGHRQYEKYYRQRLPRQDTRASTAAERAERMLCAGATEGTTTAASGVLATRGVGGGSGHNNVLMKREARSLWLQKRENVKLGISQNRLNRTFYRVFEA